LAYTVEGAFTAFYEAINLDGDHRQTANARRDALVALLKEKFDVLEAFATGSIPRFTALNRSADLDVIVALHYGKHIQGKSPSAVLQQVRDALSFKTLVRKNGQAVTLYYQTWPNVDIVPVARVQDSAGNITHYQVPNANTESWIDARPARHSANVDAKASECGANFRRVIKMLKWWNETHGDYLQSYHIEVMALEIFYGNSDNTPLEVFRFFSKARPLLASPLFHDLGPVDGYLSYSDRAEILKRWDWAVTKAGNAWLKAYGSNNDQKGAIELWREIFGEKFPSYG
jgi:hypothetical protein